MTRTVRSLCPVCLKPIEGEYVLHGDDLYLDKTCPEHGTTSTVVWRGTSPSYEDWGEGDMGNGPASFQTKRSSRCPYDCGICNEHTAPTCTILVEITERCNMGCPICFASATAQTGEHMSMATFASMLENIVAAGGPYPLQLSGGEPTVHPLLPEFIALAKDYGFKHVQVNTNGLRIAQQDGYLETLRDAGVDLIYLQCDGVSDETYRRIRGRDLAAIKRRVLERCQEAHVGVQLVPVLIRGVNDHELGDIVKLAKEFMPAVKGIHFQPCSYFGRYEIAPSNDNRITIPDVLRAMEEQTEGEVALRHFIPRKKHDTHCGFSAYYVLAKDGRLRATTSFDPVKFAQPSSVDPADHVRDFITTHSRYVDDSCCDTVSTMKMNTLLERARIYGLSISGMPFMDAWTVDLERLQNCCVHVARSDGRIMPFCANYLTAMDGRHLEDLPRQADERDV